MPDIPSLCSLKFLGNRIRPSMVFDTACTEFLGIVLMSLCKKLFLTEIA